MEVGQKLLRAAEDGSLELRLKAQARGARAAAGKVMEAARFGSVSMLYCFRMP